MAWYDFYKLFTIMNARDPLAKKREEDLQGVGITQPDVPDLRGSMNQLGAAPMRISVEGADFIDMTTVQARLQRYKEYDRLQNTADIENALTTFADEACLAGETPVATPFGFIPIKELAKGKKPDEQFLVYCWDFEKEDYTLGWAYHPRLVKKAPTVKVYFDNGTSHVATPDHRFLLKNGEWRAAGDLKFGDLLKPFYRIPANQHLTKRKTSQFPRIFTTHDGWKHERQFIDEWKTGKNIEKYDRVNEAGRFIAQGLNMRQVCEATGWWWKTIEAFLNKEGFTYKELRWLGSRFPDSRRVVGVVPYKEIDVYDLSVQDHENFATDVTIVHNCQEDNDGHLFKIKTKNEEIKKELEFLRRLLKLDSRMWSWAKNLYKYGDGFLEIIVDPQNPKGGILKVEALPADSMHRIESVKGRLIEFQQNKDGPDYNAIAKVDVMSASLSELQQSNVQRFTPGQIIHMRIGESRKTFYPYGVSIIEAARGPAHLLHLMEDAMLVYRLCLTGESRVRTHDGWKPIKDIQKGDSVYCVLPGGKQSPTEVIDWMDNGEQDILKVRSQHIEIRGTKTHPILVNRGGVVRYVDFQDLKKGDMLLNITHDENVPVEIPRIFGEERYILRESGREKLLDNKIVYCQEGKTFSPEDVNTIRQTYDLDDADLMLCNKREINPERINLPNIVDEDFARLFGFMLGDGFLVHGNQLGFATSTDEQLNEYYKNLLEKYFGKVSFWKDKRSKHPNLGKYMVSSKIACQIFLAMGYIPGARNKRIPTWAFNASKSIRKALIEGLSDADGCERHTKAGLWFSTIELCNKELIQDIKEIWHGIGLCSGHIKKRERKGGHEIEPGRKMPPTTCWSVTISHRELPKYERIWSIKEDGREKVYDITVADGKPHNFVVNGTPVHNTRAPERRVFYIDVGQMPPYKVEAFMDRMKDQFRKKKVFNRRSSQTGASAVDERYVPPPIDDDIWVPMRSGAATRIDTLQGAANLGETDDVLYFRNKLYTALMFPRNYLSNQDPNATRLTLAQQDTRFARLVERLQKPLVEAVYEIMARHLKMRGWPEEEFFDLEIKFTPPSDWRSINRNEVLDALYNRAATMKGTQLMSDYDILVKILGFDEEEAKDIVARRKAQTTEEMKMQIISANPSLMGLNPPENEGTQIGTQPGGPNPMLSPDQQQQGQVPEQGQEAPEAPEQQPQQQQEPEPGQTTPVQTVPELPNPTPEEIKKYNLEIAADTGFDDEEPDEELGEEDAL